MSAVVLNIETESTAEWRTCQAIVLTYESTRVSQKPLQLAFSLLNLENKIIVKTVILIGELPRYKYTVGIIDEYRIDQSIIFYPHP